MKKILTILTITLVVSICTSCNRNQRTEAEDYLSLSCKNAPLYQFLHHHVYPPLERDLSECRSRTIIPYIFAYFFSVDSVNYITVWRDIMRDFRDIISRENPDKDFTFRYLRVFVDEPLVSWDYYFEVIVITNQYFDSYDLLPHPDCFIEGKPDFIDGFSSAGVYARTYRYFIDGDYVVFERQEVFNIDFLGEWWVEWEHLTVRRDEAIREREIREGNWVHIEPTPRVVRFRIISDSEIVNPPKDSNLVFILAFVLFIGLLWCGWVLVLRWKRQKK